MRIINMNQIKKIAAIFIASLVTVSSAYCCNDEKESTPKNSVQDTAKAALYFDDELNFLFHEFDDIKEKDIIECYEIVEQKRSL